MANKVPTTSVDNSASVAPAAPVASQPAVSSSRQRVEPGPVANGRGADGKFVASAAASSAPPAVQTAPVDTATQAARDKLYETWPEMANETWGPRPEKQKAADPAPASTDKPKAQDAPKVEPAAKGTTAESAKDKAVKALKLDGFTDSQLKKLDDAEILELGVHATQRHSEIGRLRALSKDSTQQTTTAAAAKTAVTPRQLPPDLQALVKEHADEVGSEKAGKVLETVLLRYEAREEARALERVDQELAEARTALRESLPGLANGETFEKVIEEMVDLRTTKRWGDAPLRDVMQAAYSAIVPPATPAQLLADRLQTDGLATAPPAVPSAPPHSGPKKGDDVFDTVFDALRNGLEPREATRMGRIALRG